MSTRQALRLWLSKQHSACRNLCHSLATVLLPLLTGRLAADVSALQSPARGGRQLQSLSRINQQLCLSLVLLAQYLNQIDMFRRLAAWIRTHVLLKRLHLSPCVLRRKPFLYTESLFFEYYLGNLRLSLSL